MARRHRSYGRKRRATTTFGGIGSIVGKVAPYIAFAQQLTEKDIAVLPAGRTYQQQGKDFINIITGRMAGFHLFQGASDYKPPFTINPSAIISSKWVQGGALMIAYSLAGKKLKFLPKAGKIGSIGKKLAFGGAIGALFDAPNGSGSGSTSSYVAPAPAGSNIQTISYSQPMMTYGSYSSEGTGLN